MNFQMKIIRKEKLYEIVLGQPAGRLGLLDNWDFFVTTFILISGISFTNYILLPSFLPFFQQSIHPCYNPY